ncbi:MAG: Uma2 family endonuclease [Nitrospirae bacterium]|nr:Uma2 family endonuclease [Nitrospirota bacterium]
MSVMAQVRFNYEDYCSLPEGKRYEIIDGGLHMTPAPTTKHQHIAKKIAMSFVDQVEKTGQGVVFFSPIDVYLSDEDVVQPDVLAVEKNRVKIIQEKYVRGAPDIVVEIISPEHSERDRVAKKKLYFKYGVKEYWIVDPEARSIEVLVWENAGYNLKGSFTTGTANSSVFPSLSVNHSDIFAK